MHNESEQCGAKSSKKALKSCISAAFRAFSLFYQVVGETGFEPATSTSRTQKDILIKLGFKH